jgi:hypothetical protein
MAALIKRLITFSEGVKERAWVVGELQRAALLTWLGSARRKGRHRERVYSNVSTHVSAMH